jgi:secreted trypsin-like serine protease
MSTSKRNKYYISNFTFFFQICTRGDDKKSICRGDSGSPLIHQDEKYLQRTQEGIVSYGTQGCLPTGTPTVFTKVQYYLPWIIENIQ